MLGRRRIFCIRTTEYLADQICEQGDSIEQHVSYILNLCSIKKWTPLNSTFHILDLNQSTYLPPTNEMPQAKAALVLTPPHSHV